MSQLCQFLANIQADGGISEDEVPLIRQKVEEDGQLDVNDVKLLIQLYCEAKNRCPSFDELFFSVLEEVIVSDGQLSLSEEYFLLKMLYAGREVREPERAFLRRLRKQLPKGSQGFEELYEAALSVPAKAGKAVAGRRS
jgi:uncharacterized tellurite resistance protein B-like protein